MQALIISNNRNMKIGILTCHDGINHGSFLQAYCLQKTIELLGFSQVEIINYKSKHAYKIENETFLGSLRSYFNPSLYLNPQNLKYRISNIRKVANFKKAHRLFNLTRFSHDISQLTSESGFDIVLLGSDEIWNFKNPVLGGDLVYFGEGVNSKKIASYATSFGQVSFPTQIPHKYETAIKQLNFISVRDTNSQKIVSALGLQSEKVLDPTFLYSISDERLSLESEEYILVYMTHINPEQAEFIKRFSRQRNIRLVALGYNHQWCDKNIVNVGVFEWLNYFRYAKFIFTNSFHGTIYSILNKQDFCIINPDLKSNKIYDLLDELSLQSRVYIPGIDLSKPILYDEVFETIELKREHSIATLKKILIHH